MTAWSISTTNPRPAAGICADQCRQRMPVSHSTCGGEPPSMRRGTLRRPRRRSGCGSHYTRPVPQPSGGVTAIGARLPELQRLHRWHHPWTSVVVAAGARLIGSGCKRSLRNDSASIVPAVVMVRSAVDRNPREHRYRTAALYAVLPALSHFATLPTSTEYTAPRLKAEQKRTGRATGAVTVTEIVIGVWENFSP